MGSDMVIIPSGLSWKFGIITCFLEEVLFIVDILIFIAVEIDFYILTLMR